MSARTVMVALDAADLGLIRRYAASGAMPVMADLLARGTFGRLASVGRWLPGSVEVAGVRSLGQAGVVVARKPTVVYSSSAARSRRWRVASPSRRIG